MKTYRILSIIFVSFFCLETVAMAAAKIAFENPERDMGKIVQGDEITEIFRFRNLGDAPLVLYSARGSCGCMAFFTERRPINPNETGELKVIFDSKKRRGEIVNKITVKTNAEESPTILRLKVAVVVLVEAIPSRLDFGVMKRGERAQETITLINHSEKNVAIKGYESSRSHIRLEGLPKRLKPSEKREVRLHFHADENANANLSGRVTIKTDHPRYPKLSLFVFGKLNTPTPAPIPKVRMKPKRSK